MENNSYLCTMNKAEEQQLSILASRVSSAEREKHEAQRQARLWEEQSNAKDSRIAELEHQLSAKVDEMAESVRQIAQMLMGSGMVTLSDTLRESIIGAVREEFERRERDIEARHAKELQELRDWFALQLAAKDNEIAALKAKNGNDSGKV